ncbi:hypothetical protein RRG08_036075 [Elysia crispata]|uniref:Uncharacterized protein n=1 Tax=Elysia crispata TaxID=231223 RepID=A0AAE1E0R2_9GAST|nr:hypothetical protein RRG08_036075 [Elysia crispata]
MGSQPVGHDHSWGMGDEIIELQGFVYYTSIWGLGVRVVEKTRGTTHSRLPKTDNLRSTKESDPNRQADCGSRRRPKDGISYLLSLCKTSAHRLSYCAQTPFPRNAWEARLGQITEYTTSGLEKSSNSCAAGCRYSTQMALFGDADQRQKIWASLLDPLTRKIVLVQRLRGSE